MTKALRNTIDGIYMRSEDVSSLLSYYSRHNIKHYINPGPGQNCCPDRSLIVKIIFISFKQSTACLLLLSSFNPVFSSLPKMSGCTSSPPRSPRWRSHNACVLTYVYFYFGACIAWIIFVKCYIHILRNMLSCTQVLLALRNKLDQLNLI